MVETAAAAPSIAPTNAPAVLVQSPAPGVPPDQPASSLPESVALVQPVDQSAEFRGETAVADAGEPVTDVVLETYPLHPAAMRLWAWSQALLIALALLPLAIGAGVWQGPWALLAIALVGLLAWRIAARHLRQAVAHFRCERFARGLRYRHGVWWQSEIFIPSARVQHTEVNQGPLARRYGMGKLKVFTAAVQLGALEIDGLAYTDAVLLRDRLLGREAEFDDVAAPVDVPDGTGGG